MDVTTVEFDRQYRTNSSEGYHLRDVQGNLARLDLHFASSNVYASLVLRRDLAEAEILSLIKHVDEALVMSAETPRDDFYVSVYRGDEVGFFSDDFHAGHGQQVRLRPGGTLERNLDDMDDSDEFVSP